MFVRVSLIALFLPICLVTCMFVFMSLVLDCRDNYQVFKTQASFIDREVEVEYLEREIDSEDVNIVDCPSEFADSDDPLCKDYVGQIRVEKDEEELEVVFISKSYNLAYPNAMVVVEHNPSSEEFYVYQYTVYERTNELHVELLFYSSSFEEMHSLLAIEDTHVVAYVKEGGKYSIKVIYYFEFWGEEVPENYGMNLLSDVDVVAMTVYNSESRAESGQPPMIYVAFRT